MTKSIILIGGPQKGTRFRPLSLDIPKPLFPVGGVPLIQHHVDACIKANVQEIYIIGSYTVQVIQSFIDEMQLRHKKVIIKYLQEFTPLGTAGSIYHFRDRIRLGNPEGFFVLNGDVCFDFPLIDLQKLHQAKHALATLLGTEATRTQSLHYGCMAVDKHTCEVHHYVEKPKSYVSNVINCGIYMFSLDIFVQIGQLLNNRQHSTDEPGFVQLEVDIFPFLAGTQQMFALETSDWWCQVKTAGSTIYANRHYFESLPLNVCIHASAKVDPSAVVGPNVSVGANVTIGAGARIRESIILDNAVIGDRSLVIYAIVGHHSRIGAWARVEGIPSDPDPNKPFAKMDNMALFNNDGRLNQSITILGAYVDVNAETVLRNCIILPNKKLGKNKCNEIIL